jgi:protein SCO1/2
MPFEQAEPRARRDWLKRVAGGGVLPAPRFPNLPVVTHEGRTVRFYDDLVRGRTVVFNMMYTVCTGICPISTANLLQVQQALGHRLGRDLFMYSLTLQPQFDDPRALRDYMQRYGIRQPGWTYLTGQPQDMDRLRRALGFFDSDPALDGDLRTHTGMVRAGNDALNRWLMVPAFSSSRRIVSAVERL